MAKFYLKSHEWFDSDNNTVGISSFAAKELGDVVYVELPQIDDELSMGEACCTVESVKAVSEIYSPVTGKVIEINESISDNPATINEDAENSWFFKVEVESKMDELMDEAAYAEFLAQN